jgi:hypothetical protein
MRMEIDRSLESPIATRAIVLFNEWGLSLLYFRASTIADTPKGNPGFCTKNRSLPNN